jgi:ABC-type nitrate/sulfonate/bicarbonate transport system substrate-binding protein
VSDRPWDLRRAGRTGGVSRRGAGWTARRPVTVAAATVAVLTLGACSSGGSGAGSSSSNRSLTSVSYAITNVSHVYDAELLIQSDPGMCAQYGVKPNVRTLSQAAALPALIAGQIDMVHIASGSVLQGALKDATSTKIVAGTGGLPFVLFGTKDITTVADLKGQTVAASTPGSGGDLATRIAVEEAGLTVGTGRDDVKETYTGSSQTLVGLGASGAIKAFVFLAPLPAAATSQGVHQLKALAGDPKIDAIAALAVSANSAYLKANPQAVKGMLQCLALAQKEATRGSAVAVAAVAKALNLTPADATEGLALNKTSFTIFPFTTELAHTAITALQKYGVQQFGNFDPATIIDNSLVPKG